MSDKHIEIFEALADYMFHLADDQMPELFGEQLSFDLIAKDLGVPVEWVQIVSEEMELV